MRVILFFIIYFLSLIFEISFVSLWNPAVSVSFWVFMFFVFFLDRKNVLYFGVICLFISFVFYLPQTLYAASLILGTVSAFLLKSMRGLGGKAVIIGQAFLAITLLELLRFFSFISGIFTRYWTEAVVLNFIFFACLFISVIFYETKKSINRTYRL